MKSPILLVDDNPRILSGARLALEMNGFNVATASNGNEALKVLEHFRPDLIVSDILMPECDGFSLLERVHSSPEWITIPFLFLTALNDEESLSRVRDMGADDFLTKPFSPATLVQTVKARLERARKVEGAYTSAAYLQTITLLARAIEARDTSTGEHVNRVADYARELAWAMDLPESQVDDIQLAAIIHDIGKVTVPNSVLNKPGKLTSEEWAIMKTHPRVGADIISTTKLSNMVIDGVLYHHERFDGSGYPEGLIGEQIPLAGRILAVVDAYDAMTSDRPYHKGLAMDQALEILQQGAGIQFDPKIVAVFLNLISSYSI